MDAYDFTINLIESNTILDYETYTENAIKAILANDLTQHKFIDMLNDFKSFEGNNHKFCINFTGSWLKYALDGVHNKDKIKTHKLIRDVLGEKFTEKEMKGGATPHQLSTEIYEKINWKEYLGDSIIEDKSPQRKYMIIKCNKQRSNNSWHEINMIIVRPKDLLDIMTTSKCVTEYRKYFITLSEIRRSYQETYLSWVIEQYKHAKLTLEQKVDKLVLTNETQSEQIEMLLTYGKDSNIQIHHLRDEVSILNIKIDNLFDYLLSFARMTIPTWIGSTVIKQQYDTLAHNKDNNYALKHLKVLFMVGFYVKFPKSVMKTKSIGDDKSIRFKTRGIIKMYACCTNFADIGPRIKLLYSKYTDGDNVMFMMKPTVITLISCEVNLERIVLENGMNIFPEHSIIEWDSKFKCYNVSVTTAKYEKAHEIFDTICTNAGTQRFQGYQQRIDKFNTVSDAKVDENIINYIDKVDERFFSDTKPFCQQYIDSYYYKSIDSETDTLVEYAYGASNRKCTKRVDLDNANLTNCGYALRKLETLIEVHSSSDHIKFMADAGILTKENLPTLKAIAKFENIDTSELEEPSDSDEE